MAKKVKKVVQKSKSSKTSSGMPLGVKIISFFAYAWSFLLALLSVFLFGASALLDAADAQNLIKAFVEDSTASTTIANDVTLGIFIGASVILLFAIASFVVARKLAQGKNWARILLVVFFGLGFVGALADILMGSVLNNLADLVIDGTIAGYLLFNKNVQRAFSN